MAGKCGDGGVADTHWAACLVAEDEEGKVCPHNFLRLDDDLGCLPYGSRSPEPYKKRVCCLMGPVLDLKVNMVKLSTNLSFSTRLSKTIKQQKQKEEGRNRFFFERLFNLTITVFE